MLLQLPGGKNVLYDAGSLGSSEFGARNIAGVLWSQRIEHLDAVVLSHADVDHFNALKHLVEKFSVGVVCVSPQMQQSSSGEVKELFAVLKEYDIPIRLVAAGNKVLGSNGVADHFTMEVLGPPSEGTFGNDNSNSVVLMIEHRGKRILLPGDLERDGLTALLERSPIDFDVVVAAHHGSKNSLPEEFMKWSTPEFVAISGGSQRVSDAMVARFAGENRTVSRTDQDGAIRYEIGAGDVTVKRWVHEPW